MTPLLSLLRAGPARPRGGEAVWDIGPLPLLARGPERNAWLELRGAVLSFMDSTELPVFLLPAEDPPDPELARHLVGRPDGAWEVPAGRAASADLHDEMSEGGWILYAADEPVQQAFPDPFRGSAEELAAFMHGAGVKMFVASFLDDTEWVVGLE